ncbi:MAG: hypothetical protein MUC48_25455 [Leptolyngbya sp. Prado105]|jgi:hypothetical protein|nr:hypothetical protein [Leptolyngbya sp. Prado105]
MKSTLLKSMSAAVLAIGIATVPDTLPASAQTTAQTTTATTPVVATYEDDNNGFPWGLLGLLGLIGLAGLGGNKDREVTAYRDPNR